jgi:PAS domain S-box-containing protein
MPVPSATLSRLFLTLQEPRYRNLANGGKKKGVTMLSMSSGPSGYVVSGSQQSSQIGNVILRASSNLAKCEKQEIESIILHSIADVSAIEGAERAGWFLLTDSGSLTEVFHVDSASNPLCSILGDGLHRLPWCMAQLNAGKAVLICDTADLSPAAEVDRMFLKVADICSLILIPSDSASLGRTVLILSSNSTVIEWSAGIVEQCTLLEDIFSNAYQRGLVQDDSPVNVGCFQRLFAASISAMVMVNRRGRFISSNAAFSNMLGYSEVELRLMKFEDIFGPLSRWNTVANRYEQTLIGKNKTPIPARISTNLIDKFNSEDIVVLVGIEDLTGLKAKEAELSRRQTEVDFLASLLIQSHENERKCISRELHDDIGQRLSLAASEVALMASQQSEAKCLSVDRLEVLRDELDSLCTDIHEMSHDLHSYKLQHLGLKSALKDLCRRLSQPDFRVDLYADEFEEPTSKDVALCLYRVAQESLNNALKHAHALVVAMTITKVQEMFYLTIQDSGVGFDSNASRQGLGLVSMGERIKLVHGSFRMHSVPGRGTEIWVAVPDRVELAARTGCMPLAKTAQLLDIGALRATA